MLKKIFFLLVFSCCWSFIIVGQQFNEKQVQLIDGNTYYLHKVEQGNTLYSISKMYSIPIKDLIRENPSLEQGLKIEQIIRIPVKKVSTKVSGKNVPVAQGAILIHTVEPKETLYGLSKKYDVEVKAIEELNPELAEGMKIGLELKIPMPESAKVDNPEIFKPAKNDSFLLHLVEPKETFYSLAKEYDVNIDSLRLINDGLADGLKVGTTIRIPIIKTTKPDSVVVNDEFPIDIVNVSTLQKSMKKGSYKVCLMLPFYLEINDSLKENKLDYEKDELYGPSKISMSFYTGLKLALDSLNKAGYQFELIVFDTKYDLATKSTSTVEEILMKPDILDVDLFIGPFHRANFEIVANYAHKLNKPIVTPVPQNIDLLKLSPYILKTHSSSESQLALVREFVLKNHSQDNLVLMENNFMKDIVLSEKFSGIIRGDTNFEVFNKVNEKFHSLKVSEFDPAHFAYMLNDSLNNIVVVPLENKTFVTRLLNVLNKSSRDYNITVYGLDKWTSFGYLDYRYLNNLKVHLPMTQYVNYDSLETEKMVLKYKMMYNTEPNEWGFLGYDIGLFFLGELQRSGTAFYNKWEGKSFDGIGTRFQMDRLAPTTGYENRASRMVKMENYYQTVVNP